MTQTKPSALMPKSPTLCLACAKHTRPQSHHVRSLPGLLMLALYLPLVLMIAIGPMIANTDHFHLTISHGTVAAGHHHLDSIAQADALELGFNHVHPSDSLQLNALVASDNPEHHRVRLTLKTTNPMIDYDDVFPDSPLRPPRT